MSPEQQGELRCDSTECLSKWEDPAHYVIIAGGQRKNLCGSCFLHNEYNIRGLEVLKRLEERKGITHE